MQIYNLIQKVQTTWKDVLLYAYERHGSNIDSFLSNESVKYRDVLEVLPSEGDIFNAFIQFNIDDLNVVILGQDCYPTKGDAMGLCFSVPQGLKCAASLRNIFKELERAYGVKRINTDLTDWAQQGVLLLNTALTVREGCAGSHLKVWKPFTWEVVKYIASHKQNIVYILWGNHAQEYEKLIDTDNNLVLKGIHPSPLAARSGSFVGCGHFELCNEYLRKFDKPAVDWV